MTGPIITQRIEAAEHFIKHNVCARCYGDLTIRAEGHTALSIQCDACGDAWNFATIRRSTAERRGQDAMIELLEVKHNLPDLFPNPHRGRPREAILEELGF